jgi:hypothetical protein
VSATKPFVTKTAEELLEDLAAELEIPDSRYEAAERSYRSVGSWLERPASALRQFHPFLYPQGSFRLGTVTKPADDKEHYDLDVVCELSILKNSVTQESLKKLLGTEVEAYAEAKRMAEPGESRRCWTLEYADGAQFHMDLLPALPDASRQRLLLEQQRFDTSWTSTAIAITDRDHLNFRLHTDDWPSSNPRGYAQWFINHMRVQFEERRRVLAEALRRKAEDIPDWRVKTPLQQALQILKRHRDVTFAGHIDDRPISVILTTLAARSYRGENRIAPALFSILEGMDQHIETRNGVNWIPNPTDPRENFADRWLQYPERRGAFHNWLGQARQDFANAARAYDAGSAVDALAPRLGRRLVESAANRRITRSGIKRGVTGALVLAGSRAIGALKSIVEAPYRKRPIWPERLDGAVRISRAVSERKGHRPKSFTSDSAPLKKNASLTFEATTTVRRPFHVYWQITNTGHEALAVAGGGRGTFQVGDVQRGKLTHGESTLYSGAHGVECFIVKDGCLVARSGVFVVNIA